MPVKTEKETSLPNSDIASAYTVAMYFAQRFEQNLRAILYTGDYLKGGEDLQLTPEDIWRYKSKEGFVDKSVCGAILKKLRKSPQLKGKVVSEVFDAFNNACSHRNELAHWFLAEQDFSTMNAKRQKDVIRELHGMSIDLYIALEISYALAGDQSQEHQRLDQKMLKGLVLDDVRRDILKQIRAADVT